MEFEKACPCKLYYFLKATMQQRVVEGGQSFFYCLVISNIYKNIIFLDKYIVSCQDRVAQQKSVTDRGDCFS